MVGKGFTNWFKRLGSEGIEFERGELKIMKVPVWLYPLNSSVLMQKILVDKFGEKEIGNLFYNLGKAQSKMGVNQMLKIFGYKKDSKFLNASTEQPKTIGYGNLNLELYDPKKKIIQFKNTNTPFARKYLELFGVQKNAVDHFIRGSCGGVGEIMFGKESLAIEKVCIAQGKEFCLFEVKPLNLWDKNDPLVKEQMISNIPIIEEKEGLKYYLKK